MLASYFLSRTLVPTMVHYLLAGEVERYAGGEHGSGTGVLLAHPRRLQPPLRARCASGTGGRSAGRSPTAPPCWWLRRSSSCCRSVSPFFPGEDFFPAVDAGQFRLHVRAPAGTRIEETERLFGRVAEAIRQVIPADEIARIIDNMGIPLGSINLAFSDSATIGPADGEILISLSPHHRARRPTT